MDEQRLLELKEKYWSIYQTDIDDESFIWRELTRSEFRKLMTLFDNDIDREEYVCKVCVLEPKDFDFSNCRGGIPSTLTTYILQESGFGEPGTEKIENLKKKYDKDMESFEHQVSCIISEAFNYLTLETIDNWPLEKTMWYYSRAKYKLSLRGIVLVSTEEMEQEKNNPAMQNGVELIGSDSNAADFPELAQQKAFMAGKLK